MIIEDNSLISTSFVSLEVSYITLKKIFNKKNTSYGNLKK